MPQCCPPSPVPICIMYAEAHAISTSTTVASVHYTHVFSAFDSVIFTSYKHVSGGGTSPASPVLAVPLFAQNN